jgi:Na+(H+)/acetate symporter ActP
VTANSWAIAALVLLFALTFYLGYQPSRTARGTPDFLVAGRRVPTRRNAAAVSGEFLSAASFLGIAGLVFTDGPDALWYPVGFTAGFVALLLFVAAPLRRSGAYTVPDFVEARLGSAGLRGLSTVVVILIGFLYLVPQLQGAGLTLAAIVPVPSWVGAVLVVAVVLAGVIGGGMRSATLVQAVHYWVQLFAITAPAFVLCAVFLAGGGPHVPRLSAPHPPQFTSPTTVHVTTPVRLHVEEPVTFAANGLLDGRPTDGGVYWGPGTHTVGQDTTLRFAVGTPVPVVAGTPARNASWLSPRHDAGHLLGEYSLILALFAGTMGLPHVLVRFYTNPDGRAARRTTLAVLMLLGLFYLFPTILGVLSRLYEPELLLTGRNDAAILLLPARVLGGIGGQVLGAVVAAGAFAAFLATCTGLLVSLAGVLSTDAFAGRVRDFRTAALVTALIPLGMALVLRPTDITTTVGMAFALAASTFCPVLVLGIWWRGLTWVGAASGMVTGGGLVVAALGTNVVSTYTGLWAPQLLAQPGLVTIPLAFAVTVAVSRATARRVPTDVGGILLRLHAPDPLGFSTDRQLAKPGGGPGDRVTTPVPSARGRHRR